MTNPELRKGTVQITHGGYSFPAYLAMAEPQGGLPLAMPAVVVLQEIFGVNAHIRSVTERIAREGYIAIAPALYHRQAPGFESGYTQDDITIGRQYKAQCQADELLGDIQATVDYLKALPGSNGHVGCIGFCFGGHVAYLAATLPDIRATASFYGAGIPNIPLGEGFPPTLSRTADIQGTLHAFFGDKDPSIPPQAVAQIEAVLQNANIDYQIFCYPGAEHGFFCDQRQNYNATAAADAWKKVNTLFKNTL
jgi:carboxymethylenebutenolidase